MKTPMSLNHMLFVYFNIDLPEISAWDYFCFFIDDWPRKPNQIETQKTPGIAQKV